MFGCAIAHAEDVEIALHTSGNHMEHLIAVSFPWKVLVCSDAAGTPKRLPLPAQVLGGLERLGDGQRKLPPLSDTPEYVRLLLENADVTLDVRFDDRLAGAIVLRALENQ